MLASCRVMLMLVAELRQLHKSDILWLIPSHSWYVQRVTGEHCHSKIEEQLCQEIRKQRLMKALRWNLTKEVYVSFKSRPFGMSKHCHSAICWPSVGGGGGGGSAVVFTEQEVAWSYLQIKRPIYFPGTFWPGFWAKSSAGFPTDAVEKSLQTIKCFSFHLRSVARRLPVGGEIASRLGLPVAAPQRGK